MCASVHIDHPRSRCNDESKARPPCCPAALRSHTYCGRPTTRQPKMPFFSRFRNKDPAVKSKKQSQVNGGAPPPPPKPRWADAWLRKDVEPEEVQELLRGCTSELKSKGMLHPTSLPSTEDDNAPLTALDFPFLLLPFRPASDPSAARTFIRNFFNEERGPLHDVRLEQELMLTEPMVSGLLGHGRGKAKGNRSCVAL